MFKFGQRSPHVSTRPYKFHLHAHLWIIAQPRIMYTSAFVLALFSCAFAAPNHGVHATPWKDCGTQSSTVACVLFIYTLFPLFIGSTTVTLTNVSVSGCNSAPCKVERGSNITTTIYFTPSNCGRSYCACNLLYLRRAKLRRPDQQSLRANCGSFRSLSAVPGRCLPPRGCLSHEGWHQLRWDRGHRCAGTVPLRKWHVVFVFACMDAPWRCRFLLPLAPAACRMETDGYQRQPSIMLWSASSDHMLETCLNAILLLCVVKDYRCSSSAF